MKKYLLNNNLLNEIDVEFANFICELQGCDCDNSSNNNLWLLAALLSYSVDNGDSAFNPADYENKPINEIFNISQKFNLLSDEKKNEILNNKIPEFDIKELLKNSKVIGSPEKSKPIVYDGTLFYLHKFYNYEKIIAEFIKKRIGRNIKTSDNIKKEINSLFPDNFVSEMEIVNWQKVAAILALSNDFLVISGGPGTGKTTTAGSILALLLKQNKEQNKELNIKMVAPTGKAADRLNESIKEFKIKKAEEIAVEIINAIPENAQTIHRFLGINSHKPAFTKYNKAPVDVLLIDEASMVSLPIFAKTFEVLNDDCKVILLGDKDQLMAVENGNVLNDITSVEELNKFTEKFVDITKNITDNKLVLPVADNKNNPIENIAVQLEHSWRFNSNSGIGELSKAVNSATSTTKDDEILSVFDKFEKIEIKNITNEEEITKFIKKICEEQLKDYVNSVNKKNIKEIFEQLAKFRILCAINNGPFGVKEINKTIEQALFPDEATGSFYNGQSIMITKNDYNLKLSNGDVGVIIKDEENGEFKAYFKKKKDDDKEEKNDDYITYNPSSLDEYTTAFAISIHKSQGSEFDKVFIIFPPSENRILTKELLYTGITRAKEECTIIAGDNIFVKAAKRKITRQSGLKSKLIINRTI